MNHFSTLVVSALVALSAGSSAVQGQWTVTNLGPGQAYGIHEGRQVGGVAHASLWSGSAESLVDLHPFFQPDPHVIYSSVAVGVFGNLQVGTLTINDDGRINSRAVYWNGSSSNWGFFYPQFTYPSSSWATATDGVQTVGTSFMLGDQPPGSRARIWGGAILHPATALSSDASGVHAGQQVGKVHFAFNDLSHASLWSGTPESWIDLHPADAVRSEARGIHSGQQVGYATFGTAHHAGLWTGSAASWVDLHPTGATLSQATAVYAGLQVGYALVGGVERASLWSGSAGSWENLNLALTGSWGNTRAQGIYSDGSTVSVVGYGINLMTGGNQALLWTRPIIVPCAADFNDDGVANSQDFFDFLAAFFALQPAADFNHDTVINSADFFDFLAAFFTGC